MHVRPSHLSLAASSHSHRSNPCLVARQSGGRALVIAPPGATASPWVRKFGQVSTALASGWMQIRGTRRRKAVDRGFALSDHADWNGLNSTIAASGAEEV